MFIRSSIEMCWPWPCWPVCDCSHAVPHRPTLPSRRPAFRMRCSRSQKCRLLTVACHPATRRAPPLRVARSRLNTSMDTSRRVHLCRHEAGDGMYVWRCIWPLRVCCHRIRRWDHATCTSSFCRQHRNSFPPAATQLTSFCNGRRTSHFDSSLSDHDDVSALQDGCDANMWFIV